MTDRPNPRDSGLPDSPDRQGREDDDVNINLEVLFEEEDENNMADQAARDQAAAALAAAQAAQAAANQANQAIAAAAAAGVGNNQPVAGSQLSALNDYNGDPHKDIDVWLEQMDNFARQFQWNDANTAAAAKAKLTDKAAFWLASQRKMNRHYPAWNAGDAAADPTKLRLALRKRFKPTVTAVEATAAIIGLKQKENEAVQEFYDRVCWAVDRKNYKILDKTTEAYRDSRDSDVFAFFGAGLKEKIASIAMSGGEPPDTHEALLERAVTIEITHEKSKGVFSVEGATGGEPEVQTEKEKDEIKELTKQVAALTKMMNRGGRGGRGRGGRGRGGRCYRCQETGHFVRNCPQPAKTNEGRGGHQRGRGNDRGGGQRGGGQRGGYTPPAYLGQHNYDAYRPNFGQGGYHGQRQANVVSQPTEEEYQYQNPEAENY